MQIMWTVANCLRIYVSTWNSRSPRRASTLQRSRSHSTHFTRYTWSDICLRKYAFVVSENMQSCLIENYSLRNSVFFFAFPSTWPSLGLLDGHGEVWEWGKSSILDEDFSLLLRAACIFDAIIRSFLSPSIRNLAMLKDFSVPTLSFNCTFWFRFYALAF